MNKALSSAGQGCFGAAATLQAPLASTAKPPRRIVPQSTTCPISSAPISKALHHHATPHPSLTTASVQPGLPLPQDRPAGPLAHDRRPDFCRNEHEAKMPYNQAGVAQAEPAKAHREQPATSEPGPSRGMAGAKSIAALAAAAGLQAANGNLPG